MKIRYDSDADALSIKLREDSIHHTKELDENTIVDYNDQGEIVAIEILFVKERNPDLLKNVKVEGFIVA